MMRKTILGLFLILTLLMSVMVQAADFPTKEVQIIIPWAAGGATDLIFRALAATSGKYLGKPVVVVCRSGNRSELGTLMLQARGFDAHNLEGGIEEWYLYQEQQGKPGSP